MPPAGPYYWARIPLPAGQAFELAGWEPLPSGRGTEAWVTTLLGAPAEAELVIYADPGRGTFRYASLVDGRLDACLFLARNAGSLPPRGCRGGAARHRDRAGRRVWACWPAGPPARRCRPHDLRLLRRRARARCTARSPSGRLTTVAEIGAALRAGTNCGSCIPELKAILRDVERGRAAA